jgi:hypothetical protein
MTEIDEIDAIKQMSELMEQLDEDSRARSLNWLISKYGSARLRTAQSPSGPHLNGVDGVHSDSPASYSSFAELFDAAQPNGERDKALVAAYWEQICMNAESFPSQTLNDQLKDLGHGVSNITDALTRLKSDRPSLILQLKKSGTSKQSRKTYKLTQEGIRRVNAMIAASSEQNNLK